MAHPDRPLKDLGLWYPRVPPDSLKLNGVFHRAKQYLPGFNPVLWTHFGGPKGAYLKHLTRISLHDYGRFIFQYDRDDIPEQCSQFGRKEKLEPRYSTSLHFDIDGPGGERIIAVQIRRKYSKNIPMRIEEMDEAEDEEMDETEDERIG